MGRQGWSKRSLISGSAFYSSNHCQESHMDERLGYSAPLLQTSRNILTWVNNSSPIFCTLWAFLRRCEYIMPCSLHRRTLTQKVAYIELATAWFYIRTILKDFVFIHCSLALFISAIHIQIKILAMIQTFCKWYCGSSNLNCIIKLYSGVWMQNLNIWHI